MAMEPAKQPVVPARGDDENKLCEEDHSKLEARWTKWKTKLRPGKRSWCSCVFSTCCSTVIAVIVAAIVLGVQTNLLGVSIAPKPTYFYSPGDTQLIGYSSLYCQGLDMSAHEGASLYLVPGVPQLSDSDIVYYTPVIDDNPWNWYDILHADSTITVQACVTTGSPLTSYVFIMKGRGNALNFLGITSPPVTSTRWKTCCSVARAQVMDNCGIGNTTIEYTVTETDIYYVFTYDRDGYTNTVLSWNITRTEYSIDSYSQPLVNCSSNSSETKCTLPIPYLTDYRVLLIKYPGIVDLYGRRVSISCNPRPGPFVLVAFLTFLASLCVLMIIACACICCLCPVRKNRQYSRLKGYKAYCPDDDNNDQVQSHNSPPTVGNYRPPSFIPVREYPMLDPVAPVINNYPAPNPAPPVINNYPAPDPVPIINNYPPPNPTTYPQPDPVMAARYPPPDPTPVQPRPYNNNYPPPDPTPIHNNYYPQNV